MQMMMLILLLLLLLLLYRYCNWVSIQWQQYVNSCKNRKMTATYKRRSNTENKKKPHKQNGKQKYKTRKQIQNINTKHRSSN